ELLCPRWLKPFTTFSGHGHRGRSRASPMRSWQPSYGKLRALSRTSIIAAGRYTSRSGKSVKCAASRGYRYCLPWSCGPIRGDRELRTLEAPSRPSAWLLGGARSKRYNRPPTRPGSRRVTGTSDRSPLKLFRSGAREPQARPGGIDGTDLEIHEAG